MKDIKVIIATHKKYEMPKDNMYIPIHVGAEGKDDLGYTKDNIGDNISLKNPFYCELTGMYWAWKNLDAEYVGLAHYRRHFCLKKKSKNKFDNVLTLKEANKILENVDVIVPKKRNYIIENLYSHYEHTLYVEPLDEVGRIIEKKYPEYSKYFEQLHKRTSAHMFNMFIMKKNIFDGYCEWLFDILSEVEKNVDQTKYDSFHARFYGRLSELLLDIYLMKNGISYKEVGFIYMEKINVKNKVIGFLKSKFKGEKYGKSF
ncbi:MAG: DUF4422 domain-containing protein [Tenericutes bacterium]|nr:DUF4422 domain-containing protein [Mycoplasmatota bacterium]